MDLINAWMMGHYNDRCMFYLGIRLEYVNIYNAVLLRSCDFIEKNHFSYNQNQGAVNSIHSSQCNEKLLTCLKVQLPQMSTPFLIPS
jgi:hypothetical protein